MYIWSWNIIKKDYPISVDWKFLVKNALLFLVLAAGIYYIKDSLFVLEDSFRYKNILYLLVV